MCSPERLTSTAAIGTLWSTETCVNLVRKMSFNGHWRIENGKFDTLILSFWTHAHMKLHLQLFSVKCSMLTHKCITLHLFLQMKLHIKTTLERTKHTWEIQICVHPGSTIGVYGKIDLVVYWNISFVDTCIDLKCWQDDVYLIIVSVLQHLTLFST